MILLQGHGLTRARKIPMETLSLSLSERASTASMTPADMTGIGIGSWMLDETDPGAGIVWRVKTITQAYATDTPTVQLEHVINTLRDVVLFGEHTPSTISGGDTCTAEQAIRYILARQSDWVLYRFDYPSVSNPYKFDGDTLFDALETVTNSLDDAWWEYDMSVYPFRLSIVQKSADVLTEMRAGRNIRTINRKVDKTGMYTRFYPIGESDLHITGDYVERNATTYGVISKVETDNSIGTEAELRRWAEERLRDHAEPTVSIDVDGVELADATGESLDKMHLGAMCRIPLPEFNTTILERIVGLSYLDKVHQPESVRITLANNRTDITRIVADAIKSGATGKSGRASAKRAKQDNAWFEDTNEHVAMCAKGIIGVDAQGNPNWEQLAQIIVDGTGIHQRVTETENGIVTNRTAIEANSRQITLEAEARGAADEELSSAILLTATNIRAEVSASNCQIYSYIEETACGIIARIHNQQRQIFTGQNRPGSGSGETVEEGALWIKYPKARTWEEAEDTLTWVDDPTYNWNELGGSIIYEYINGQWVEKLNEATLAEDAYVEDTAHSLHRTYAAVTIDAQKQAHAYRSEWQQTASMLWNDIEDRANDLGSRIEQSTTQIRTEVHAAKSSLYSEIKQTATNLVQHVADEKKSIYSHIEQTASSINSSVVDLERGMYSNIRQTASEIRAHVKDVKEGLESTITQTASEIRLSVESAKSEMGSSITQTASQIRSEVHAAKSSLYSSITQTASSIRLEVADARSDLQSSITQTASSIRSEVSAAKSSLYSSIVQTSTQIAAKVGKGDVATQLAVEMGNVSVTGGNLTVDGMVTAAAVKTALASVKDLYISNSVEIEGGVSCDNIDTGSIDATYLTTNTGDADIGGTLDCGALTINGAEAKVLDISLSGNTLTITKTDGTITFSKATSLSGAWSSGTHTVTAKQNNGGTQTTVATHTTNNQIVFDGNSSSNFSVKLQTREGSASTFTDRLSKYCYLVLSGSGRNQSVKAGANSDGSGSVGSISVSSVYDDGWAAAYAKVLVPSAGTGSSVTVKWPGSTQGNQGQRVYTLQNNGNNEVILTYPDGSDTITAAKLTHNKYSAGESSVTVSISRNGGTFTASGSNGASDSYTLGTYNFTKAYDTRDNVYYGKLYDSNGNALTSSSYYWYGLGSNEGTGTSVAFYR